MVRSKLLIPFVLIFVLVSGSFFLIQGQETDGTPIEFTGNVEAIEANIITVASLQVDLSDLPTEISVEVGTTVTVAGTIADGIVTASTIVIVSVSSAPEVTPEAAVTPEPETTPEVDESDDPIIVIEGPVQEINVNVISIFDIDIQVDAADPILTEIEIGEIIRVEGNVNTEGDTIIIVAVNITVVNVVIINPDTGDGIPPGCKITKKGKLKCSNKGTGRSNRGSGRSRRT